MLHQTITPAPDARRALPSAEVERLRHLYPNVSGRLAHDLADHPLLTIEALAEASERMNPDHVEVRQSKNRNGEGFDFGEIEGLSKADTIRRIGEAGRWVMLRFAEQVPEYGELMQSVIDEIAPVVQPATGEALRLKTFIFVSSPGTLTPFHFDPEYNILFQISGRKYFAVYPPAEPWLTDAQNEAFHRDGNNLLPWAEGTREQGTINPLDPGEALYVPYKCPHWVEVGEEPSISISITWCSQASFEQDDAHLMNAWLRRRGLNPASPHALPQGSPFKANAWRLLRRIGMD